MNSQVQKVYQKHVENSVIICKRNVVTGYRCLDILYFHIRRIFVRLKRLNSNLFNVFGRKKPNTILLLELRDSKYKKTTEERFLLELYTPVGHPRTVTHA